MKNKTYRFDNIGELHDEILRLRIVREEQEQKLREDLLLVQKSLEPGQLISNGFSSLLKATSNTNAIESGIELGSRFITDRLLLRNRGPFVKFIASTALRNVAKFFISNRLKENGEEKEQM